MIYRFTLDANIFRKRSILINLSHSANLKWNGKLSRIFVHSFGIFIRIQRNSGSEMPGEHLWTLWWSTSTAILGIHILQCGELLWMRMTHTPMQCGRTHLHIYLCSLLSVLLFAMGAVAAGKTFYFFIYFPFCKAQVNYTSFHLCFAFLFIIYFFCTK